MEEYIGVIKMFAGDYAPQDYMLCQGQVLPISQYMALFSVIGVTYGGDGHTNFQLPNLCGRTIKGAGRNTNGTQTVMLGESSGAEFVVSTFVDNTHPSFQVDTQFLGLNYIICVNGMYPSRP